MYSFKWTCSYKNTLTSLSFWSQLYQYKFHDVAIEELQKIHRIFPDMIPSSGTYSELFWRTNPVLLISMHYKPDCCCYWFQRLLTAPRKICWNWSGTSRSNMKVGVNSDTRDCSWRLLCTDDSSSVIRTHLQLPRSALAVGLFPLHSSHMFTEAHG